LYFVVSNTFRIGQQAFITRTMYSEDAKKAREEAFQAKIGKGGKDGGGSGDGETRSKGKGGGAKGAGKGGPTKVASAKGGATKVSTAKGPAPKGGQAGAKGSANGTGRSPTRQAPSRTAPAGQNRSKSKKKRR
jgi:hypothetical protein